MFDGQQLGETIVAQVKGYLEREVAPLKAENAELRERLKALEDRPAPDKGDPGEPGNDGVSPEPEAVAAALRPVAEELIAAEVAKAIAALPPPERGEQGEKGDDGDHLTDAFIDDDGTLVMRLAGGTTLSAGKVRGKDGEPGKDGSGIADLLRDHEGNLVATFTDGRLKNLGPIQGKDGEPGKDGRDGFDLTSFDAQVLDDDRTVEFKFIAGEHEHVADFKFPTVIDRGVFKADREEPYEPGDGVTWGGSYFICKEQTNAKPDDSRDGKPWRLAIKKGRDGKDAKVG